MPMTIPRTVRHERRALARSRFMASRSRASATASVPLADHDRVAGRDTVEDLRALGRDEAQLNLPDLRTPVDQDADRRWPVRARDGAARHDDGVLAHIDEDA